MRSVKIGTTDSWADYGLAVSFYDIGLPRVKTYSVDLPGGNGQIDYTDYFGDTLYGNRELTFDLVYAAHPGWPITQTQISAVINAWHGRQLPIELSWDPGYIYTGRVLIDSDVRTGDMVSELKVVCDCEPFKTEVETTIVSGLIPSGGTLELDAINSRMTVIPEIIVTAQTTVKIGTTQTVIQTGSHKLPWVQLREGSNPIQFIGTVGKMVVIQYRKGLI